MTLDAECEELLRQFDVPAVGLARITDAGIEAIGCAGERRQDSGVPVTEHDVWHIGSCAKSITATLIARLVERGLLEWEAPIAPILAAQGIDVLPVFSNLTLWHLLTHTSGMPTDPPEPEVNESYYSKAPPRLQRAGIARSAMMTEPPRRPGEYYLYSNLGYIVAGVLAEAVTGVAWEELMRREVFAPLRLTSAGFGTPGKGLRDDLAQPWGHQAGDSGLIPLPPDELLADNPPVIAPAGTIHMSLPDLARYVAMHLSQGATPRGYLKPETVRFMHAPRPGKKVALNWFLSPAFGWFTSPADANDIYRPMLWHDGSNIAWYACVLIVPDEGRGLAFVSNGYQDAMNGASGVTALLSEMYANWESPLVA
jgi:CubicO group peptidase (beta-lactamase class C family)